MEHYRQRGYTVVELCALLAVARSGYYRWRLGMPSQRRQEDEQLTQAIRRCFVESRQTYGSPRIHQELQEEGWAVSRKRVARLMRQAGLAARPPKRRPTTTDSTHTLPVAPNLLNQEFTAEQANRKWAGDISYIATDEGWLYLAVVLDLYSRRVVGWAMSARQAADLVVQALRMALHQRRPPQALIYHSDRGSQYASADCRRLLAAHGIRCSMSRKGNVYDNAVVESFLSTLKHELVHRSHFRTRADAELALFDYMELFYNRQRRHSTLTYLSPDAYERRQASHQAR